VGALADRGYGIVQLPCPEMMAEGGHREPRPVEAYDTPVFNELCAALAEDAVAQVGRHLKAGDSVELFVGIEGSPSCGVGVTNVSAGDGVWCSGRPMTRVPGCGVLTRALRERLVPLGVMFTAVDNRDRDLGLSRVLLAIDDPAAPDA
jgi:uncharacterized protein YbbK (DUF523 family)